MTAAFSRLRSELRGTLVLPADDGYESARAVWNAAIDRRPAAVVRCAEPSDVLRAIDFARAQGLAVAVRGGGHGFAGKATCDGGLVVDCGPMKSVEVDPARRAVRAGAGCEADEAAAATAWVRDFFAEMTPFLASGVYANYLAGDEGHARVRAAYGRSWDRLVALKRKFDPDNFFHLNQNVSPAS